MDDLLRDAAGTTRLDWLYRAAKNKLGKAECPEVFSYLRKEIYRPRPPPSPLVLDSSVLLSAIQYDAISRGDNIKLLKYLTRHIKSVIVPNMAIDQVRGKLSHGDNTDGPLSRLEVFEDHVVDVKPNGGVLQRLESAHKLAVEQPESEMARQWLRWKRTYIWKNMGMHPETESDRTAALRWLYERADEDRRIAAVAVRIAEPHKNMIGKAQVSDDIARMLADLRKRPRNSRITTLVSGDGDMLVLEKTVARITDSALNVMRPKVLVGNWTPH